MCRYNSTQENHASKSEERVSMTVGLETLKKSSFINFSELSEYSIPSFFLYVKNP